ncbi:ankyrin repeat-containing domain protein [Baffinella frigidus]|nr:ankyrin repeat-containing domain protein [Cryptophyta sp. CCMP2293]
MAANKVLTLKAQLARGRPDRDLATRSAKHSSAAPRQARKNVAAGKMPTDGELASAAGDGNAAEVEKLLWAGAKIEEKDTDRDTLLQAPARKMRAVLAVINTQLLRSTVLKDMNLDKNSPIVVAAVALYIAVFLTCGLLADSLQFTSPFAAVVAVAATALLLLLARVDRHETKDGSTPLLLAAQNGHAEVVQLLLKAGADTSTMDTDGLTPLHFAVSNGHAAVVKLLLDAGADISGTDKNAKNWGTGGG